MATREETMSKFTVQEGADLKLDCNDDKKLIDLKYQDQTSGLLRIIFTKTTSQEKFFQKKWRARPTSNERQLSFIKRGVQLTDAGIYYCSDSMKNNVTFNVDVYAVPKPSIKFEQNLTTREGDLLTIGVCYANGSSEISQLYWVDQENNKFMGEDSTSNDEMGRYNVNNILRLKSAQSHHQKQFRCIVEHRNFPPWTSIESSKVNVKWKPRNIKISTPKNTLDLATFEQYELICNADANPPAEYTWKIRHPNISSPIITHWNFNQNVLSTQSLAKSDSGILVVCEAVNSEGMATRETRLQVSETIRFAGLSSTTLFISLGTLITFMIGVCITACTLRLIRNRKMTVYKTGNIRTPPAEGQEV